MYYIDLIMMLHNVMIMMLLAFLEEKENKINFVAGCPTSNPAEDEGLSGGIGHLDGPAIPEFEIAGDDLLAVDQGQHEPVGNQGAELFHQVQGEGRFSGPVGMEEADGGVQPGRRTGGPHHPGRTPQGLAGGRQ